jgi:hypothetical protein
MSAESRRAVVVLLVRETEPREDEVRGERPKQRLGDARPRFDRGTGGPSHGLPHGDIAETAEPGEDAGCGGRSAPRGLR